MTYSFESFALLGVELFHNFFIKNIEQLIEKYPKNLEINKQKFWSGYKKFPQALEMNFSDFFFN